MNESKSSSSPFQRSRGQFVIETCLDLASPANPADGRRYPLLVALHGQGQSASIFSSIVAPLADGTRYVVVPEAPLPLEVHEKDGRRRGAAWYIYTGNNDEFYRSAGFAITYVRGLVKQLIHEHPIDPARVVLFGYSQGGYLAGMMGLSDTGDFSGLITVAARLKTEMLRSDSTRSIPTLCLHGRFDRLVDPSVAEKHGRYLAERGWDVEFRLHECGHRVSETMVAEITTWLNVRCF